MYVDPSFFSTTPPLLRCTSSVWFLFSGVTAVGGGGASYPSASYTFSRRSATGRRITSPFRTWRRECYLCIVVLRVLVLSTRE